MQITKLKLINYRNHAKLTLEFKTGVNILVGPNGVGKTNILEAIHLLSTTRSFRAKYDRDLIKYEQQFANLEATVKKNGDTDDLAIQISQSPAFENKAHKKVKYNGLAKSLSRFSGYFYSVLFTPQDIETITGSPSLRRNFINSILSQISPAYKKALSEYVKTVKRRNKLLEIINETGNSHDQLPFWNDKLLEFGEVLQAAREELFVHFNSFLATQPALLGGIKQKLMVEYNKNSLDTKRLFDYKDREIASKSTLLGPHRDDFTVYEDGKNLAQFGSRGEQRTAVFALKLSEIAYIENKAGVKPVLLLDDIFSELDAQHKDLVLELIKTGQTVISCAEKPDFIKENEYNLIEL